MKVGVSIFCQNYYKAQRPDHQVYREDLALAELAEPLGFDSLWAVEHHFSNYTMIPDVVQFLSYLCGRTKQIGLGTMVIVLPWHDPLRAAEQIAMLDLFARDRELTLGFGRGTARREFEGMRVPMGESRARFAEAIEIVRGALTHERFSFAGRYYRIPDVALRPRPLHTDLAERFYGAIVSPESGEIMARAGLGMLIIPQKPWSEHGADYRAYAASCDKFGRPAKRPIAVCMVYCHRDEKLAQVGAVKWMGEYGDSALVHYEYDDPEHFRAVKGYEHHAQMALANRAAAGTNLRELLPLSQVAGTPERCAEALKNIASAVDAAEFVGIFKYGTMPAQEAERSMRLFAAEVLPMVHALP